MRPRTLFVQSHPHHCNKNIQHCIFNFHISYYLSHHYGITAISIYLQRIKFTFRLADNLVEAAHHCAGRGEKTLDSIILNAFFQLVIQQQAVQHVRARLNKTIAFLLCHAVST